MNGSMRLHVSEDGADAERLAMLAGFLRNELLHLDIDKVTILATGGPVPGTRGFDVAAVGGLLVGLGDSASGLGGVIAAIQGWLSRGERAHRRVRLEINGDVLELADATTADQDRLVELFVSRHARGEGRQWTASAKP